MLALYVLIFASLLYTAATTVRTYSTRVPGPWYTNTTSFVLKYFEFTRRRRVWIHSLHEKYGPVVRLAPNEVSFTNLEGMKEIYQSGGSGYDKTEFYDLFRVFSRRTMFSTLNRHDHAQRKKLFAEKYAMTNVVRPDIVDGIKERVSSVVERCKESIGGSLDVYITLHCYALDCASHFLFSPGGTNSLNNAKDFELMQELTYSDDLKQRLLAYYCSSLSKIAQAFQAKSAPLSNEFVLDRAKRTDCNETSLLHKLQSKSADLENIQMAAECMDHMAAGIDTTGDGLVFLIHELSLPRSKAIQQKLHDEIIQNSGAKPEELPYLDAVIKEGLRLFPPIPMSLPRYVPEGGRSICGYELPGHTIVSCQAYSVHLLNPDIFPHAEIFMPERWLEGKGELDRNRLFFAFASGGRGCIGKNLALMEMKTLLHAVYSRFETRVAEEMRSDMTIDDQIISSRPRDQTCLLVFEERARTAESQ